MVPVSTLWTNEKELKCVQIQGYSVLLLYEIRKSTFFPDTSNPQLFKNHYADFQPNFTQKLYF